MKYHACRVRRPPLLNSRCCELVSEQLSFVCEPSSPPKSDEAWRQRMDRFAVEPVLSMRQNSSPIDVGKLIGVVSRQSEVAHEANGCSSSRRVGSEPPCSPPRFRGADAGEGLFNMKTASALVSVFRSRYWHGRTRPSSRSARPARIRSFRGALSTVRLASGSHCAFRHT